MSVRPPLHRYETIADQIRASIARGAYNHGGGRLPSERVLMLESGAHRGTVRQALGLLEAEGLIASIGKSGWYVAEPKNSGVVGRRVTLVTFGRPSGYVVEGVTRGLNEALGAAGVNMLRIDFGPTDAECAAMLARLREVDTDALVIWPHGALDSAPFAQLRGEKPLVLVDRRVFGFESDCVLFDDQGGGRMITEHLIAQGHRRIAFLGDEPFAESVHNRWLGYREALQQASLPIEDRLTVLPYGRSEPAFGEYVRLLRDAGPTAVVCSNDGVASTLLLRLRADGTRVPEDLAVTGFGNEPASYLDLIGLTTAAQPFAQLGEAAGRLVLERLAKRFPMRDAREILIPMKLVQRTSGACHSL